MIAQLSAWDYQWRLLVLFAPPLLMLGGCIGLCIDDARDMNIDVPDVQRLWEPAIEARQIHMFWRQVDDDTWIEDPS